MSREMRARCVGLATPIRMTPGIRNGVSLLMGAGSVRPIEAVACSGTCCVVAGWLNDPLSRSLLGEIVFGGY